MKPIIINFIIINNNIKSTDKFLNLKSKRQLWWFLMSSYICILLQISKILSCLTKDRIKLSKTLSSAGTQRGDETFVLFYANKPRPNSHVKSNGTSGRTPNSFRTPRHALKHRTESSLRSMNVLHHFRSLLWFLVKCDN